MTFLEIIDGNCNKYFLFTDHFRNLNSLKKYGKQNGTTSDLTQVIISIFEDAKVYFSKEGGCEIIKLTIIKFIINLQTDLKPINLSVDSSIVFLPI